MFCIEVVRYAVVNNKGEMQQVAIVFPGGGGFVFCVTPFFLGGGGGCLKAANSGERDGWVTGGGGSPSRAGGLFPVKKFDVDKGEGRGLMWCRIKGFGEGGFMVG